MPFDKIDIESITKERRKAIAKSIRKSGGFVTESGRK
jgi:hypothetical protein